MYECVKGGYKDVSGDFPRSYMSYMDDVRKLR